MKVNIPTTLTWIRIALIPAFVGVYYLPADWLTLTEKNWTGALIFSAALRREELGMEARLSLFAELSQHLQNNADLYQPPHLSDEKLVLLCAAALAKRNSERSLGSGRKSRRPLPLNPQ